MTLVQLSDPLLTPFLGSWKLDPLSMQAARKWIPVEARHSVDKALEYTRCNGTESSFLRFLDRCKDDRIVIGPRQISFYHNGKAPFTLPIQKVEKSGRKTLLHCSQKPPYPIGPVVYSFHFYGNRLVMREQTTLRKPITHKFYLEK